MTRQLRVLVGLGVVVGILIFIYQIRGVLAPFGLAFVLAYILAPIVDRMEGRGLGRTWCILLVFLIVFLSLGFGAFKAGGKMTGEMVELSDRFLRQEQVDKVFSITNNHKDSLIIKRLEWEDDSEEQPFAVLGDYNWPLELEAGGELQIKVRFAPLGHSPGKNALLLTLLKGEKVYQHRIEVYGNRKHQAQTGVEVEGKGESGLLPVVLSDRVIGFGKAGPNILTALGAVVSEYIQPLIEPFMEEEFNLADFVKEYGQRLSKTMLGGTTVFLGGVVSGLTFVVIVPFVAFFFLKDGHRLTRHAIELVPNAYFELCLNLLHQINRQIGGYIRGQILATSVVSILSIGGLSIIAVPYALPLGFLAGLSNMIPFMGPFIGVISATIVALATGGGMILVVKVCVVFLVIQIIDNVLIQPTVVAKSVEMHPLVVVFILMVGSQLMGIVGMLIAVPLTGIIKVSTQTIYEGIRGYRLE